MSFKTKIFYILIAIFSLITVGCGNDEKRVIINSVKESNAPEVSFTEEPDDTAPEPIMTGVTQVNVKYDGEYSAVNGTYTGMDDLSRTLPVDVCARETEYERTVGIFYFLWQGQHEKNGPYDNNKIVGNNPESILSEENWLALGGGDVGDFHFWGEPMYGYYTSDDAWVMRKHIQMLTDAKVDYLVFDATNTFIYKEQALMMLALLDEYYRYGITDVPKIAYYTNTDSGATMNEIYEEIYAAHPEYSHLWFNRDGKPLIIGDINDTCLSDEAKEFFRIKANQWPNAPKKQDGFPWMEFDRLLTDDAVYGNDGRKEIVNVSIAQHSATCTMSATAWYEANDRTRSWHDGANDTDEEAMYYGYNFSEQWEWALKVDPESVFVTGWNEWVAQRQPGTAEYPVYFVDCADPNTSRDAEPMHGVFGDNYYMQLVSYIRQYKGTAPRVNTGDNITIDINGDFSQFDAATAVYVDYKGDTAVRNSAGFGDKTYYDGSGRNDFDTMKVAMDEKNIYFYVSTVEDIAALSEQNSMTLFISTHKNISWYGYDFVVNRLSPIDGKLSLERFSYSDESSEMWENVTYIDYKLEKNQMMLAIPRGLISCAYEENNGLIDISFKWADNFITNDIMSFYKAGDCAPLGRQNYLFSNTK